MTEEGKEAGIPVKETQTPTAEEQLKTLQSQVQSLTTEKERLDSGYKGLQRTLEERNKESKKSADLDSRITAMQDSIELLATAMATQREVGDIDQSTRVDVVAELRKKRTEQENRRRQEDTERTNQEYAQKGAAIYAQAEEIFGDDIGELHDIRNLIRAGDYDLAERKIEKSKKGTPKETDEQRIAKLVEERVRQRLEESGLLEEHLATPSARSSNFVDIERKYATGEITTAEYTKAREKEGIR